MNRRASGLLALVLVVGCSSPAGANHKPTQSSAPSPAISAEWTEYHLDSSRSGLGPSTPELTSPKVAWSMGLDGDVYASPLIVGGHVIAATENNTVYSLDLFTGATVWKMHLGDPVDASSLPCGNIKPITGITGTPAADPSKGRLYVVAFLRGYHHMLFALSLADGSVAWQQDIDPPGSNPTVQQQRGALALGSGLVYVPLGGLWGDCGQYRGYVVGVPTTGGQLSLVYRVPSSREAGIWTPAGPTIDPDGNVYVVTGNGSSRSTFDYSDSAIELSPDLQQVKSFFAPSNWVSLSASDTDLGSVGATLVPSLGVVLVIGKDGVAYLLKADRLGGIGAQITSHAVCPAAFGGTAWSGTTVFVPCTDGLYALSLTSTSISVIWHSLHPAMGSPIITAGAVWGVESSGNLYALNPSTGSELYTTPLGSAHQFSTPAATEGFVVVPAGRNVAAVTTAA